MSFETGLNNSFGGRKAMFSPDELTRGSTLLKKQARRTEKTGDESETTSKALQLLCESEPDYYRLVKDIYLETYYDEIKDITFPTDYSIELSKNDVIALRAKYDGLEGKYEHSATPTANKNHGNMVQEEVDDSVRNLASKIDAVMGENKWKNAFIRMSIRSPKDAVFKLPANKFGTIVEKEYESLCKNYCEIPPKHHFALETNTSSGFTAETQSYSEGEIDNAHNDGTSQSLSYFWKHNLRMIACYRAQTYAQAVGTGAEAMDLICRSRRIQGDMEALLEGKIQDASQENQKRDGFQLCVRQFRYFDVCYEFRVFIYENKITAITQYNSLCFFPDVVQFQEPIKRKLTTFVQEKIIGKKLKRFENMVLDVVLVDDDEQEYNNRKDEESIINQMKVMLVEINPLAEFASGGLFQWGNKKDREILLGFRPFEFRIQKEILKNASVDLMSEWKPYVHPPDEERKTGRLLLPN